MACLFLMAFTMINFCYVSAFPLRVMQNSYTYRYKPLIATRYGLDGPGIEFLCGHDFPHPSIPALRPT